MSNCPEESDDADANELSMIDVSLIEEYINSVRPDKDLAGGVIDCTDIVNDVSEYL